MLPNQPGKEDKGSLPESMDTTTSPTTLKRKHSELGIASFSISIIVVIVIILELLLNINGVFIGWECGSLIMSLVALGLGIWGLLQKDRKKLFAILGTIFSAVIIICLGVGTIVLGIMYYRSI